MPKISMPEEPPHDLPADGEHRDEEGHQHAGLEVVAPHAGGAPGDAAHRCGFGPCHARNIASPGPPSNAPVRPAAARSLSRVAPGTRVKGERGDIAGRSWNGGQGEGEGRGAAGAGPDRGDEAPAARRREGRDLAGQGHSRAGGGAGAGRGRPALAAHPEASRHRRADGAGAAGDLHLGVLHQEPPPARLRQSVEGAPHHHQGGGRQLARRLRGGRHPPGINRGAGLAESSKGGDLTRFRRGGGGQRSRHREGADAQDLRQAPLRLEVPPPEAVARPAGHRHQRRRPCTRSSPPARPSRVTTRTGKGKPAHFFEIQIDTRKNNPVVDTRTGSSARWAAGARGRGSSSETGAPTGSGQRS